MDRIGFSG